MSQWFFIGGAINEFSFIVIFTGAFAALWRYGYYYKIHAQNLLSWITSLSNLIKAGLVLIFLVLLYKGLGNLHPALGLGSAWHSLLCLTQIPFLPMSYQINGTLVFVVILYLHFQFTQKQVEGELTQRLNNIYLIAFALTFMPLSFLYLTAPSPDLPVLIFIPLIFYWFRFEPKTLNAEILLLLACFVFAIKPPSIIAVSIGFFLVFKTGIQKNVIMKTRLKKIGILFGTALICIGPIVYKNYIQTGHPLYPSSFGSSLFSTSTPHPELAKGQWQIPADWNKAYRQGIVSWGINDSSNVKVFKEAIPTPYIRFLSWIKRLGYKGLMNKLIVLNFFLGFILLLYLKTWEERIVTILLLVFTFLEYSILSQYRLMLPTAITLLACNAYGWSKYFNLPPQQAYYENSLRNIGFITMIVVIYCFMAFVPLSLFKSDSRNKSITQMGGFTSDFLVKPYTNYKTGNLETFKVDSITFHYYSDRTYAWDAPIPAVSLSHRQFLEQNFHYRLRALGNKPEEGFYLESITPNTFRK
jgi:hypothetical protein